MGIGRCQHTLGTTTMPFWHARRSSPSLGNHIIALPGCGHFLEGILHGNLSVAQVLIVHAFSCQIACFKRIKCHKSKAFALIGHIIPHYLGWFNNCPKRGKCIIQQLFVDIGRVQIPNEQIRPNIQRSRSRLFVQTTLAHAHRPAE